MLNKLPKYRNLRMVLAGPIYSKKISYNLELDCHVLITIQIVV